MYATSDRRTPITALCPLGGGTITDLYTAFRSEDTEALAGRHVPTSRSQY